MTHFKRATLAAATLIASAAMASAQTTQDHTQHHPDAQAAPAPAAPMPGGAGAGMDMGKMDMGKMMNGDMGMMMRMMHGAMARQAMMPDGGMRMGMMQLDRIEGRIAFAKAELAITDAQLPLWNAFADILRSGAKDMRAAMANMPKAGMPATPPERLGLMVQMMAARLDTLKAILATAKPLYAALSDEQKKTANELLAGHPMGPHGRGLGQ